MESTLSKDVFSTFRLDEGFFASWVDFLLTFPQIPLVILCNTKRLAIAFKASHLLILRALEAAPLPKESRFQLRKELTASKRFAVSKTTLRGIEPLLAVGSLFFYAEAV